MALGEVFTHAPTEFELLPGKLSWDAPCWLQADIILSPRTGTARAKFFLNLKMPHQWDAFAKASWEEQLWAAFSPRFHQIEGPFANDWRQELFRCYQALKHRLRKTEAVFPPPFHFAKRDEYTAVDLATILKENPETLSVYLAFEKRSYSHYYFLRIHSNPPFSGLQPRCLWFDKRLPIHLHTEDVLPWFVATIRRLPKKNQPSEIESWKKSLLRFEPQLAPPESGADKPWAGKPKVILVFGPTGKVGYRGMFHLERQDINRIVRQKDVLTITGKTRHSFADHTSMEMERIFHLLAIDEDAAQRVERQILCGERTHFGLDGQILGMISHGAHVIQAINAPVEIVRRLCLEPGLGVSLTSDPREKHKVYCIIKSQAEAYSEER